MDFDEIKAYWEGRASNDSSAQSTTQDIYLREIEYNVLLEKLKEYAPASVADVGCGDGRTTVRLAEQLSGIKFQGIDYSSAMIENARNIVGKKDVPNISFSLGDICTGLEGEFDAVYTTRCLINLPGHHLQKVAIDNIHNSLTGGGVYLMIENFIEGHENFNRERVRYGLPEIPIRPHNLFFDKERLLALIKGKFTLVEEVNISSTYYLASRILYSKICSEKDEPPDYFDDHHRFASMLPFAGEFGPVRLVCLRKGQ